MGSRSFRMQLFAVSVILQLGIQSLPATSLGLDDSAYWADVASKQPVQHNSGPTQNYFKADLKHFQHTMANLSITERVRMAVKRSQQRLAYFQSVITKRTVYQTDATYSSSVYSNQGSYVMTLQLGTPARKFVGIMDTGSDLVWVQGLPCTQCFQQPNALFNPEESSTYQSATCTNSLCNALPREVCINDCKYSYQYGDQSTTEGDFALDTITLTTSSGSSESFPNFGFGVGHKNQGTFVDTDGLVGLGQGPLSLVSQLGSNFGNIFSYCLVDFYSAPSVTSLLSFGGTPGASGSYTPLIENSKNPTFYYVNVVGIDVGGKPLIYPRGTFELDSSGNGGFILDSGTTVTQLPKGAYDPLLSALQAGIDYPRADGSRIGFDLCYDLSAVAQPKVPDVIFKFEGVDVDLPGNNIFLQIDNAGTFCLAMQGSPFSLGIFGNVQQQNFEITHDRVGRSVGFAPKHC